MDLLSAEEFRDLEKQVRKLKRGEIIGLFQGFTDKQRFALNNHIGVAVVTGRIDHQPVVNCIGLHADFKLINQRAQELAAQVKLNGHAEAS